MANRRNPNPRAVGVELEVAGFLKPKRSALSALYNTCVKWNASIGTDISCGPNGTEIRTAPACNGAFLRQLTEIIRAMKQANAVVDEKCGLHVHVDVRNTHVEYNQSKLSAVGFRTPLDTIAAAWLRVEPVFYDIVCPTRESNRYCQPWAGQLVGSKSAFNAYDYTNLFQQYQYMTERRSGLNLHAFTSHSTVEFRLHQGTLNRSHIIAWAQLCAAFVSACVDAPDPIALCKMLKESRDYGRSWLEYIAPTTRAKRYIGYQERKGQRRRWAQVHNEWTDDEEVHF